MSFLKEHKIVD